MIKSEVWFSGSYWGFTKTILRKVPISVVDEILQVGIRESMLPPQGHLTMICAMTKNPSGVSVKTFLTHEQLRSMVPKVYDEFVRKGLIPIQLRTPRPENWKSVEGHNVPTFVELYIQRSHTTLTIQDPWVLDCFSGYWNHTAHLGRPSHDLVRAVIYEGNRRVPIEIELREIFYNNLRLYGHLEPFLIVAKIG
ncbi:MAG: hypothetical protein WCG75_07405 [Armatimonadota bacterium]